MRVLVRTLCAFVLLAAGATWASAASVTLQWTAPGDDSLTGRATKYEIRYRFTPMDNLTFSVGTLVPGVPAPAMSGTKESFTVSGLLPNTSYYFAIKTQDDAGNWSAISNVVKKTTSSLVDVDDPGDPGMPAWSLSFGPPRPNPAKDATSFALTLPQAAEAHVAAFDLQGRLVKTLLQGTHPAGETRLGWKLDDTSGRPLPPGVYLVRAQLGGTRFERRVTVVR